MYETLAWIVSTIFAVYCTYVVHRGELGHQTNGRRFLFVMLSTFIVLFVLWYLDTQV